MSPLQANFQIYAILLYRMRVKKVRAYYIDITAAP